MSLSNMLKKYSKMAENVMNVHTFNTPVGKLIGVADQEYLYFVSFEDSKNIEKMLHTIADKLSCGFKEEKNKILDRLEFEMQEYFNGNLTKFTVPFETFGSDFQKEVWNKLLEIPYGTTQTYGTLAQEMGRSASHSRAVGAACGANAHIILIPCHRVVSTNSTGGFGCGVSRKEWLLQHEKKFIS